MAHVPGRDDRLSGERLKLSELTLALGPELRKVQGPTHLSQGAQRTCRAIELGLERLASKHHLLVDARLVCPSVTEVRRHVVV